ncbi:hypothetical protein niasHT_012907 [Heterodera trifolii]|uniref:Phosphatidylinositol transfer protein N-terminal domain-containing protein n=1 Tax=Heterodera trifolii TaxID=157864 RepID=A0ABD2L5S1_9BILA
MINLSSANVVDVIGRTRRTQQWTRWHRLIFSAAIGENQQQTPGAFVTSFGEQRSVRVATKMNRRRIVMPLTTEEYQIAQLFCLEEGARQGSMNVHEKVWNAFPYWKEELTNPDFMKDNFMIRMETMLLSDRGTTKNAFGLTKDALNECKKMVRIDIANDTEFLSADDIHSRRQHTVDIPFGVYMPWSVDGTVADQLRASECAYKLVTVKFKWLGFQTVQFPRIFCMFNRALFCSMERWYALTLTPIRLIEDEAQQALDETDELATDDPSQEMTASNGTER